MLFIKPGSMGDVIHALPVATALHRAWPHTDLVWIVDPRWEPLLEGNPCIEATHLFPRQDFRGISGMKRAWHWYRGLKALNAGMVVDLQGLLRTGLMARFSGAGRILGLSDAREGAGFFYTERARVLKNEHAVRRYLRCLPSMGIAVPERPEWILPAGTPYLAEPLNEPYIVLHPFARGAGKSMDAEAVKAFLAAFLAGSRLRVVLIGTGDDQQESSPRITNLIGRTSLSELVAILRNARFVVSVDSGPMHLAAALGAPLLSIHTWSDPRLVGPYSETSWIWQGGEIRRQNLAAAPLAEKPFRSSDAVEVGTFSAAVSR